MNAKIPRWVIQAMYTLNKCLFLGSGKVPDQLVNLILQHGVEAKTNEEVGCCVKRRYIMSTF